MLYQKPVTNLNHNRIKSRSTIEQKTRDKIANDLRSALKGNNNEQTKKFSELEKYKDISSQNNKRRESFFEGIASVEISPEFKAVKDKQLSLLKENNRTSQKNYDGRYIKEAKELGKIMGTGWLVEEAARKRIAMDICKRARVTWYDSGNSSSDILSQLSSQIRDLGFEGLGSTTDFSFIDELTQFWLQNGKGRYVSELLGGRKDRIGIKVNVEDIKNGKYTFGYGIDGKLPEKGDIVIFENLVNNRMLIVGDEITNEYAKIVNTNFLFNHIIDVTDHTKK